MDGQVNRDFNMARYPNKDMPHLEGPSPFTDADIEKPQRDREDYDVLVFRLRVKKAGAPWRFKLIRDELRKAINTISGLWLDGLTVEMEPDPYAFSDPDNPPEGVY